MRQEAIFLGALESHHAKSEHQKLPLRMPWIRLVNRGETKLLDIGFNAINCRVSTCRQEKAPIAWDPDLRRQIPFLWYWYNGEYAAQHVFSEAWKAYGNCPWNASPVCQAEPPGLSNKTEQVPMMYALFNWKYLYDHLVRNKDCRRLAGQPHLKRDVVRQYTPNDDDNGVFAKRFMYLRVSPWKRSQA